jgi:hopene-associated glycosyltransferase HpnB
MGLRVKGAEVTSEVVIGLSIVLLSIVLLSIWIYLLLFHGRFWSTGERLDDQSPAIDGWPSVVAIIPARNEADVVARTIWSLAAIDYPGRLQIIVIDDSSDDGTGDTARAAIDAAPRPTSIEVIDAMPSDVGWVGKLWAMQCGVTWAESHYDPCAYYLFTDADILHDPGTLSRLVAKAERDDVDLVSQMVMLSAQGFWEAFLVPAFVFFFAKLYPFADVNRGRQRFRTPVSAAAGGCMLVRRGALERAGGLAPIRDRIIDDCALAGLLRAHGREQGIPGRLWLGWTKKSRSIRPYNGLAGVWHMVARTAYTQLRYSPILLAGTLVGMAFLYLAGPLLALSYPLHGLAMPSLLGAAAFLLSSSIFVPHLTLYRQNALLAALLPVAAMLYAGMTVASAVAYYRGRGGAWKGRFAEARDNVRNGA